MRLRSRSCIAAVAGGRPEDKVPGAPGVGGALSLGGGGNSAAVGAAPKPVPLAPDADFSEELKKRLRVKGDVGDLPDNVRLGEAGWKARYYSNKFGWAEADSEPKGALVRSYYEGLLWVMHYYYRGCTSWEWYFPYHYAPFASDLVDVDVLSENILFSLGRPFRPFTQLMGVMPASSGRLVLPKCYSRLMSSTTSPILEYYPEDFEIDLNGKRFAWQGVALLPFVDEKRLHAALEPLAPQLTAEESARNSFGRPRLLAHSNTVLGLALLHIEAALASHEAAPGVDVEMVDAAPAAAASAKSETAAVPMTEALAAGIPVTMAPAGETPAAEASAAEGTAADASAAEANASETPAVDAPAADASAAGAAVANAAGAAPVVETPGTETLAVASPASGAPAVEAPATDLPATPALAMDASASITPAADAKAADALAVDKPATKAAPTETAAKTSAAVAVPAEAAEFDEEAEGAGEGPLMTIPEDATAAMCFGFVRCVSHLPPVTVEAEYTLPKSAGHIPHLLPGAGAGAPKTLTGSDLAEVARCGWRAAKFGTLGKAAEALARERRSGGGGGRRSGGGGGGRRNGRGSGRGHGSGVIHQLGSGTYAASRTGGYSGGGSRGGREDYGASPYGQYAAQQQTYHGGGGGGDYRGPGAYGAQLQQQSQGYGGGGGSDGQYYGGAQAQGSYSRGGYGGGSGGYGYDGGNRGGYYGGGQQQAGWGGGYNSYFGGQQGQGGGGQQGQGGGGQQGQGGRGQQQQSGYNGYSGYSGGYGQQQQQQGGYGGGGGGGGQQSYGYGQQGYNQSGSYGGPGQYGGQGGYSGAGGSHGGGAAGGQAAPYYQGGSGGYRGGRGGASDAPSGRGGYGYDSYGGAAPAARGSSLAGPTAELLRRGRGRGGRGGR